MIININICVYNNICQCKYIYNYIHICLYLYYNLYIYIYIYVNGCEPPIRDVLSVFDMCGLNRIYTISGLTFDGTHNMHGRAVRAD